jgi:thiosulfate/3-mercaptopyruvate sulfurtransferase
MSDNYYTIISPAALIAAPSHWVVVDCRHQLADPHAGYQAYTSGHIPGAFFLHLDRDLAGPMTGQNGRHPLPDPAVLSQKLMALGVGPETQVVAYDDAGGAFAARLWWLLRWMGHDAVAVLDGGWQHWVAEKYPIETGEREPASGQGSVVSTLGQPIQDFWIPVETVEANLKTQAYLVIDARSPDRYQGENETMDAVGGHIPGAINRFFKENLSENGRFKPAARLLEEWSRLLAGHSAAEVICQCGSGVTACHNLLALEMAGLQGAKLYPGSWSEWCANPARPVIVGA